MRPAAIPFLLALAACGGGLPAKDRFPVGIFGLEKPEAVRAVLAEGFDSAQAYEHSPAKLASLAKEARRRGLKLLLHPHGLLASSAPVRGFPMAAWYLQDEPDVARTPAAELCAFDKKVKAWSPGVPTAFVVGDGRAAKTYAECADVLMVDWYPVPHLPLESLGDHVRLTVEAAKGKPVWAVLQAMDWKDYPQRDPGKPRIGRFPDVRELRFMSYDAVAQGARGLWYYTYTMPGGRPLTDKPELWFAVAEVSREMTAMRPIFERGTPIPPPVDRKGTTVTLSAWRYRGRDYVVAVNRKPNKNQRLPADLLDPRWRPLFEVRRYAKEIMLHRHGAYYLKPFQVMVFESRVRWKSLLGLGG